jgi:uncharacterized protein (TIGR03435 family)
MNRLLVAATVVLCFGSSAMGQAGTAATVVTSSVGDAKPAGAVPAFEVVDVHASPHTRFQRFMDGGRLIGDRYAIRQATIPDLIANAYGLDVSYVVGGPTWLDMERYDLAAKAPAGTPPDTLKLMLKGVLKDRFGLVVHEGTAPTPVYALRVASGQSKLKPAADGGDPGCTIRPDQDAPKGTALMLIMRCHNQTMEQVANLLQRVQGAGYLNKPVVDMTGLKDNFDFEIRFTFSGQLAMAGAEGVSLFDALQNQAGLKLAVETAPRPVLVVDSVNEAPTPNQPGIEKLLPPLPQPQFDVSTVRPSSLDERGQGNVRGGQLDLHAITLKNLIVFGWDVNPGDKEGIVGEPAWLDKDKFDFIAKVASDDSGSGPAKAPQLDDEQVQHLIRGLIEDRFKMKSHTEMRPVTVYTLVAAGPKIKPAADPKSRMKCTEGVGPDGKDPRQQFPIRNRLMWCQNMTMAMFARELEFLANGFIYYPVKDDTGLKGGFDFALNFTSIQMMGAPSGGGGGGAASGGATSGGGGAGASASAALSASDPNGAISLFDAVKSELGLKLERGTRQEPVLVIDHIEEKPTEN